MANQIFHGYGGSGHSTVYSSRTGTEPYLPDSSYMGPSRFLSSDAFSSYDSSMYSSAAMDRGRGGGGASSMYLNHNNDGFKYTGTSGDISGFGGGFPTSFSGVGGGATVPTSTTPSFSQSSWLGVDGAAAAFDPVMAGVKRSHEALYHQTYLGTNNTFGQSEALFSANSLGKRPRFESSGDLPIYPQRPGEKDCSHYMLTRTCKFGESCKFDHPVWVPEGGIADWKEVPLVAASESLPVRLGEPDCPYFLKTQKCKFGFRCKFNHPKYTTESVVLSATVDVSGLPERPSEPPCIFYMKTGKCKFGASCKFHHPKDIQVSLTQQENGNEVQTESAGVDDGKTTGDAKQVQPIVPFTPALLHNSKGLPVRLGEVDCPFYIKTGSCKYGGTCRYNHPDRNAISPAVAGGIGHIFASTGANMNMGVINPAVSILPSFDPRLAQSAIGLGSTIYPQRPGQIECDFYMKTGDCKFGEKCKFHHPIDRSAPIPSMAKQVLQQNVKLTLAGLPRREDAIICPFYMKTATCKYGVTCRFDHPPPGEAIAMATVQGTSASIDTEGDQGTETNQEQQHQYLP